MLINWLQSDPGMYFVIVLSVIVSIVIHELAHGYAAIWQGDDTPIHLGHMTPNPVVHMGWVSIILVAVIGIGWGMMPVNPSRFRSKYGDALVAVAGPLANLLIAFIVLTIGIVLIVIGTKQNMSMERYLDACRMIGTLNLILFLFNLLPIPPLDGSRILANFNNGYREWLVNNRQAGMGMLIAVFILIGMADSAGYSLFAGVRHVSDIVILDGARLFVDHGYMLVS